VLYAYAHAGCVTMPQCHTKYTEWHKVSHYQESSLNRITKLSLRLNFFTILTVK